MSNVGFGRGSGLRFDIVSQFSRPGHTAFMTCRLYHVADFGDVPCAFAGSGVRLPSGDRESGHADEQEHDTYREGEPGNCVQTFHAFLEES